ARHQQELERVPGVDDGVRALSHAESSERAGETVAALEELGPREPPFPFDQRDARRPGLRMQRDDVHGSHDSAPPPPGPGPAGRRAARLIYARPSIARRSWSRWLSSWAASSEMKSPMVMRPVLGW